MRNWSLRNRYLVVTALLILFVFVSAGIAERYLTEEEQVYSESTRIRNEVVHRTRLLRSALLQMEKALESFMWAPMSDKREQVHTALQQTLDHQRELQAIPWAVASYGTDLKQLGEGLSQLGKALDGLMDTRLDRKLRYPFLTTLDEISYPGSRDFRNAAATALQEVSGRPNAQGSHAHNLILEARYSWDRMVAGFRLFAIGSSGLLPEETRNRHRADVELWYQQLQKQLQALQTLQASTLGSAFSESVKRMSGAVLKWHKGYTALLALPHQDSTDDLSDDLHYTKNTVGPFFTKLWAHIEALDTALEASAQQEAAAFTKVAENITHALWALTFAGLIVISFGFTYFQRRVLAPITLVARALRAEAGGQESVELPEADSEETRQLVEAFADMRRQVQERQRALEHLALHDSLTGLPNRTLLQNRIEQSIQRARRNGDHVALLTLNLNGFKEINDSLGHRLGDTLLRQLSARLRAQLRDSDTVARLGADEFGILLEGNNEHHAIETAHEILGSLEAPFEVDTHNLFVSCSIGIAAYPLHAEDAPCLLRRADVAMYEAKKHKSGLAVYDRAHDRNSLRRLSLANDLRRSIAGEALNIFYQPQVDLQAGQLRGLEALLRWSHPIHGNVRPDEFISVAERTGLIRPLTVQVLDRVLQQCADWRSRGLDYGTMGINLSVSTLHDPGFLPELERLLEKWNVPVASLMLEITETAVMLDPARAVETLSKVNALGLSLAVDDFGTGLSSLAYLKQLPVQQLKIDKSFVTGVTEDENDAVIVRSTIDLAHNLGLAVVAEGVESRAIWDLLQILHCDLAQGFWIGKPMSANEWEAWLSNAALMPLPAGKAG